MADPVASTFENIAANIRVTEGSDLETKLRNFFRSNSLSTLQVIPMEMIERDQNIRETPENPEDFLALVASVRTTGVVQPPVLSIEVLEHEVRLHCVAGHRRLAAASQAGLEKLQCIVRKFSHHNLELVSTIVENTHRKNLHPFELAEGVRRLVENQYSFEELESLFDRNQWNLRRYHKMNQWTPLARRLILEHPEKFTPTFLLHLAARSLTAEEVEEEVKKKLGLCETPLKRETLRTRFSGFCEKKALSSDQRRFLEEALVELGLMKPSKKKGSSKTEESTATLGD